jgi:hypothetical protein
MMFINVDSEEEYIYPSYFNSQEGKVLKKLVKLLVNPQGYFRYPKEWFGIMTPYNG